MALATSIPFITDLTMKFSRHSLKDPFQLPASFNFYQCYEQAKDIAFYNQFFTGSQCSIGSERQFFQFTGSKNEKEARQEEEEGKTTSQPSRLLSAAEEHCHREGDSRGASETAYANHAFTTGPTLDKKSPSEAEEISSDEEELAGYFASGDEWDNKERTRCRQDVRKPSSRLHTRKRSMELEDSVEDVKRPRRPRLNFEKMQLCRQENDNEVENCFRPISPRDSSER